jgi:hypothetical protein
VRADAGRRQRRVSGGPLQVDTSGAQGSEVDSESRVGGGDAGPSRGGSTDDMDAVLEWLAAAVSGSCGLIADCGGLRLAPHTGRRVHRPSDVRKPMVSPAAFVTTTCGFNVPDSTSTWHAPRGSSGGYDTDCKPLSSTNVPVKSPGGPRRARTDDLRIKRAAEPRWKGS